MSDKPLFEGIDEQEARYAPEELPPDNPQARQARIDEGATGNIADEERPAEDAVVTGAAAGTATVGAASGTMGSTGPGGIPAAGPLPAGEALVGNTGVEDVVEDDDDRSA